MDTDGILNVKARDVKTDMATSARIQVLGAPEPGAGSGEQASPQAPSVPEGASGAG